MNKFYASIIAIGLSFGSQAQPVVDIGAFPNLLDVTLEIKVRPHEDFGGVVSGVSFTLRWPEALGAGFFDTRVLECPDALVINPVAVQLDTGYYSRTFNAFGTELLFDWACEWSACEEVMVMYLPAASTVGLDQVEIVPGSFVISLNGVLVPGDIYPWGPCATTIGDPLPEPRPEATMIFPVPAENEIILQGAGAAPQSSPLMAFGTDGRPFRLPSLGAGHWDVSALAPGLYELRIGPSVARFIKR